LLENLDFLDLQVLNTLQNDGRIPVVELSKKVNLSAHPCTQRKRRLEEKGVIMGYHARINPAALDQGLMVFVTLTLKATDEASLKAFNMAVKPVKQVLECHLLGGGFDYLLKIRARDVSEYRKILGGIMKALPMIEATHSYFVMEHIKENPLLPIPRSKGQVEMARRI